MFNKIIIFLCFALIAFAKEREMEASKYLKLNIQHNNPFNRFQKYGNILGVPLPVVENKIPKYYKKSPYLEQEEVVDLKSDDWELEPFGLSHKIFNVALKQISPIFSQQIDGVLENYIPKVNFNVNLDAYFSQDTQNLGGDINLTFPILEHRNSSVFFLGGFIRDSQTGEWSEKYGIEHQMQYKFLQNIIFRQSLIQNNDTLSERIWNYGLEYSPFRNFSTYIQRENRKIQKDSTKTGVRYRIVF